MHTTLARPRADLASAGRGVRRLGVLALLAMAALSPLSIAPATAWGQLYGRPVAQPCFDFPNWARYSDCRPGPLPWGYDVFPDYGPVDGACGFPESIACEVDFVAHRPSDWYAMAEFAPLTLDYQGDFDIASIGPAPDGDVVLDTGALRPEFDAGGKFTIGRRIFDCYRIEGTYLGNYDWQDTVIVTNADGDLSTFLSGFADPPVVGLDNASSVTIAFESSFQSAEVNLRYWAEVPPGPFDVSYLVGARYIRIDEQFNFVGEVAPATTNDLQVNTENEMYGVQLGLQAQCLKTTRWWFDFDLKGGIYNNDTGVTTSFLTTGDPETGGTSARDRTAWVGDIAVALNWQMTPTCAFRVGYQGIFINGLALAPNNAVANADLLGTTTARLDDSGELAYHGPTLGLVWVR